MNGICIGNELKDGLIDEKINVKATRSFKDSISNGWMCGYLVYLRFHPFHPSQFTYALDTIANVNVKGFVLYVK